MLSRILSARAWLYSSISFFELATSVICIAIHMKMHPICLKAGNHGNCSVQQHIEEIVLVQYVLAILFIAVYLPCSLEQNMQNGPTNVVTQVLLPSHRIQPVVESSHPRNIHPCPDWLGTFRMGSLGNLPHIQHDLLQIPMPGHHKLPQECNTGVFSK